jgi:putative membrane protein
VSFARACTLLVVAVLAWSRIGCAIPRVWLMETLPVMVGGGAMLLRWRAFPWTPLAAAHVTLFSIVLCVGGHWTYAHVPLGEWLREAFDLQRNHYDRIGHFLQGVVPALLARELLLRCTPLRPGKALFWVVASIALAISATYELIEWWAVLVEDPVAGPAFLGSQGDVWDAQWDMALALSGALLVQVLFARWHDRQLARLAARAT